MRTFLLRSSFGAAVILLTSCSWLGMGGSSEYGCKATTGVTCEPVSSVYNSAISGRLPDARAANASANGQQPRSGQPSLTRPAPSAAMSATVIPAAAMSRSNATNAAPIRSQPKILRGWIVPYEDADGDLVGDSYIYIPVDGGRWMVEHARQRIREAYAPARPTASVVPSSTPASTASSTNSKPSTLASPAKSDAPDLSTFTSALKDAAGKPPAPQGASK